MTRVVVHGGGRMAREVAGSIERRGATLLAVVSRSRPDWLGEYAYFPTLDAVSESPDLLIDFTLPGGTAQAADWCRAGLVPLVSGTTGLTDRDEKALASAAELVPVLWAPNLSKGLNLLLRDVAGAAASVGPDSAVEILDIHHRHKKDAPSGTALALARAVARAWRRELDDVLVVSENHAERAGPGQILCHSRREGEVIGEHRVRFVLENESIEFTHAAESRNIYAAGSLEAGQWLLRQPAGLYSTADWLSGAVSTATD